MKTTGGLMGIMDWTEALDVGVHDMNDEHKALLSFMNRLFDLHHAKAPAEEQGKILDALRHSTIAHFQHEEAYMASIEWEGLHAHKTIHKKLLENFLQHYSSFKKEGKLSDEFFHFLKFWLSAHIQGVDKKYGSFAKEKENLADRKKGQKNLLDKKGDLNHMDFPKIHSEKNEQHEEATMSLMNWNDALDIGVHEMNVEHKILLDFMNKLFQLHNAKASFEDQKSVLNELKSATVTHFNHEEAYMEKIGWEGLPQHKYIHQTLIENFTKHYDKFMTVGHLSDEFFHFLKFWLSAHIQGIDKKYGEFANTKKKAS